MFSKLVEERIREAQQRGDFDDLPGAGKPLPPDDAEMVPQELRMAFKVLRNAGYPPPELVKGKELLALQARVHEAREGERERLARRISYLTATLGLRPDSAYYDLMCRRLTESGG